MSCTFCYQLVTSLLLHIVSTGAIEYVTVPDVYTAIEEDAIIKCYIMFTGEDLSTPDSITFQLVGTNLKCNVNDWYLCPPIYVTEEHRPENFSCGCLSHTDETSYIFYLYLKSCPRELDNTRYQCNPTNNDDKQSDGRLRLIDFSKKPDREIFKCEGERVFFPWEYNPSDFGSQLVISRVRWLFYPAKGEPVVIGTFESDVIHSQDKVHFGDRASVFRVPLKETIPLLEVNPLQPGDVGVFQIEIIFLSGDAVHRNTEEESVSSINETFSVPMQLHFQGDLNYDNYNHTDPKPPETGRLRTQSVLSKRDVNDYTDLLAAVDNSNQSDPKSVLLVDFIDKIQPILRSSTTLHIVEPLREELSIVFKKMRRSDELFLYCSVLAFTDMTSFEHITFVLKQHDTVLTTSHRQSFLLLKIDQKSTMDNYSCEITGQALRCTNKGWSKNKTLRMEIDYLLKDEIVPPQIDMTFTFVDVIVVLEGVVCVFLLIWNCILMTRHVGFLCSRRARREKNKLQNVMETAYLERKSALEMAKKRMKFSAVVPPANSENVTEATPTADQSRDTSAYDGTSAHTDAVSIFSVDLTDQEKSAYSWREETDETSTDSTRRKKT